MKSVLTAGPKRESLAGFIVFFLLTGMAMIAGGPSAGADPQLPLVSQPFNLATTAASVTVNGASSNDHITSNSSQALGLSSLNRARAIATGDFNGDGLEDIAIGAPDTTLVVGNQTRTGAGAVYVIFGRPNFTLPTTIDTNPNAAANRADIIIRGSASATGAPDALGFSVAAGDVNGDGTDDLLMGAPGADFIVGDDTTRQDTGAVFIIFGGASLTTGLTFDLNVVDTADALIRGVAAGDRFGAALAVGNVGGPAGSTQTQADVVDILIGAPANRGPNPGANARVDGGAAYLVYGGSGLNRAGTSTRVLDLGVPATLPFITVFGSAGDQLGSSVAIGDVNSGGVADLIIGAPLANRPSGINDNPPALADTGAVFGIFGGNNLIPGTGTQKTFDVASAVAASRPNISIYGADGNDLFGASVATGDVTGDGTVDLVAGAPGADGPANQVRAEAGEAYLFVGGTTFNPPTGASETRKDIASGAANLTVFGGLAGDRLGATVATGQVNATGNKDTVSDFLLGAPGASGGNGNVSVIFGGAANILFFPTRDLAPGIDQDDFRVLGEPGSQLGWAIAAADIDGNRGGDLIMGAPLADVVISQAPTRTDAGRAYVLLTSLTDVPPLNQNPTVTLTDPNGGETINGGNVFEIKWTASDPDGDATLQRFEIRLSTDGGANFNTIITSNVAGTARSFLWSVPTGLNTSQARIQVTAFDNAGGQAQDSSDENFTITDAGVLVTLLSPNGGETFNFGQTVQITWNVPEGLEDQIAGFDLYFTPDDGNTFFAITPLNPLEPALAKGVRTFAWTVPSVCTNQGKVLVVATSITNALSFDESNSTFTIAEPGPTLDVNRMNFNDGRTKLILRTTQPAQGAEVRFSDNVTVEISTDETGTTFVAFPNVNVNGAGNKVKAKGQLNGQSIGAFFPDGATRFLRITNPVCGVTLLRVMRAGGQLIVVPPAAVQLQRDHQVWQ